MDLVEQQGCQLLIQEEMSKCRPATYYSLVLVACRVICIFLLALRNLRLFQEEMMAEMAARNAEARKAAGKPPAQQAPMGA